jgi:maltooligosyltrehalose trehalohydrolase
MDHQTISQGAHLLPHGVRYSVWAPDHARVEVRIFTEGGAVARTVRLLSEEDGYFRGLDPDGRAGDLFKLAVGDDEALPFPASHYQPAGVQGPGCVVDHTAYRWHDHAWVRPLFRDLVIYELHIGTFTPAGTFLGAIEKLPYLRDLGVNAIEIMPVADFPGNRGWGYDGVQIYAPARCYGTPDEMRAFVDAAHANGLAVILDVVYNHLGPDGNYLSRFSSRYFSSAEKTPWGDSLNYGHEQSRPVRDFFRSNLLFWMEAYHIDGFRLDATHAIIDPGEKHVLQEFAETVHARGGYIVAEDERNEARLIDAPSAGGYGMDAVWADDFHHTVEVAIAESSVYRPNFTGEVLELAEAMAKGWIYAGQPDRKRGKPRGTPAAHLAPERFIFCISNHDQAGNRALGERLNHLVSPATYRAASALLLLAPYTPLLFMGQEWATSAPFQYFTDHTEELGRLVEEGRRREFKDAFAHSGSLAAAFPSPQAEETFLRSKLPWGELEAPAHAPVLELYRTLLQLRARHPEFRPGERGTFRAAALESQVLALRVADWLVLCDLRGGHAGLLTEEIGRPPEGKAWRVFLGTNEARFGGDGRASFDPATARFDFAEPEALLLRADTSAV